MEEKLLLELNSELKKMEEYRARLAAMEKSQVNDVRLSDCDTLINHVKRAIARTEYADKIAIMKNWVGIMLEAKKQDNSIQLEDIAAQLVYELFDGPMSAPKEKTKEAE